MALGRVGKFEYMQQVEEINHISLVELCVRLHYQLGSCNGKLFFARAYCAAAAELTAYCARGCGKFLFVPAATQRVSLIAPLLLLGQNITLMSGHEKTGLLFRKSIWLRPPSYLTVQSEATARTWLAYRSIQTLSLALPKSYKKIQSGKIICGPLIKL